MQTLAAFEIYLKARFEQFKKQGIPEKLLAAMEYSLFSAGKRIRPLLMFATALLEVDDLEKLYPVAAALEMVHTYSLIHDDLPCMDNDVLRRGKPTNHVVFGEDIALLAGDALLSQSFELLTETVTTADKQALLIQRFAQNIGATGMVAGQVRDMELEATKKQITLSELQAIHYQKTGKLLEYAIFAAETIYDFSLVTRVLLENFTKNIGILYQAMDDYLDVAPDIETGKTKGIDQANDKITYLTFFTAEELKNYITTLEQECRQSLILLQLEGKNTKVLELVLDLIVRKS